MCGMDEEDSIKSNLSTSSVPYAHLFMVSVPVRRPITKKQYETWNLIWPLVFHESMEEKYLNQIVYILTIFLE